jgi:hypothetical protein
MTSEERERLIEYLQRKMCKPCRESEHGGEHAGCQEALELIAIVKNA